MRPSIITLPIALAIAAVLVSGCVRTVAGSARPAGRPTSAAPGTAGPGPTTVTPARFDQVLAKVEPGLVRVTALACGTGGHGSGVLVDATTVVTAQHIVDRSVAVSVLVRDKPFTAKVDRVDAANDVAVLRLSGDAGQPPLALAKFSGAEHAPAGAVAFPDQGVARLAAGEVTGVDKAIEIDGRKQTGVTEVRVESWPGSSGGPLVDQEGGVTGVIVASSLTRDGLTYATPVEAVRSLLDAPTPTRPEPTTCDRAIGPADDEAMAPMRATLAEEVAAPLVAYFTAINGGTPEKAYEQLSPRQREKKTLAVFAADVATSYDFGFAVVDSHAEGDSATVALRFTSLQADGKGPDGESCTQWSLVYSLVRGADGALRIDGAAAPVNGRGHQPCA